ncbi:velvet factor-domain-containing protein [Dactylonectria estremocensis]|uniref:Velvet factor-domain-containing protein n=1 Tax=Dactylonectria estremocensis TaxID=1079267 RepID=A0A9P9JC33_9HYPO|nr:velvet factor-domain-containing protein [Dactylonectria estremocensis]
MAALTGNPSGAPFMVPYDPSMGTFIDVGNMPSKPEAPEPIPKSYGDSERELFIKQAPIHARVAQGKEKVDRKPVDPPPVVQLIDRRVDRRNALYNIAENHNELIETAEPPTSYLTGSLASSIHHLKDAGNADGGYFVFGDLSVKQEGTFRLRFTLYDRDTQVEPPSVYFVSEIVTNPFTVYAPKEFPGMAESTLLTRSFTDQGVKLRLRKDSRAITTRKRNRQAAEKSDVMFGNKRPNLVRSNSGGAFGTRSSHTLSPNDPQAFLNTPVLAAVSGPQTSQAHLSTSNSSPSVDLPHSGGFLSSPSLGHFPEGYSQLSMHADMAAGPSLPSTTTYNPAYHTVFSTDGGIHQGIGPSDGLGQGSMDGLGVMTVVPHRTLSSPYQAGSDQLYQGLPDMSPRTPGSFVDNQYGGVFIRPQSHDELNRDHSTPSGHYGVF